MTASTRTLDPVRRLSALVLLGAGVVGVPIGLWRLGGAYLPDQLPSWAQVTAALSGPDTGALFLGLLVVIGWAAWAVFALSVAVELLAQLRGLPPVRLPGLAAPQQLSGLLVAAVVGIGGAPLLAAPALADSPVVAELPAEGPEPAPAPAPQTQPTAPAATGPTYTVAPRDTLGRIAARYLGDWARFEEILDLNRGRPQPDGGALTEPGLIRPGWVLLLPHNAATAGVGSVEPAAGQVVVRSGDTLTGIAAQHGADGWQPVFDLNAGEPLPGGDRFTDPDLIRPGQVLDLPPAVPAAADPPPPAAPRPPAEGAPPPASPEEDEPATPAQPSPTPTALPTSERPPEEPEAPPAEADSVDADADSRDADADPFPSELATVLAGSGALLAAGVGAAWLTRRRQRLRRRRPGRRLVPLPPELSATQTVVTSAAAAGTADYAALDLALRALAVRISADPDGRLPDVIAARLDGGRLELRLHVPADRRPPPPWTADDTGLWWSVQLDQDTGVAPEVARARLAPYPTLVTLGTDGGRRWLLDLERIGAVYVTGPADRRENLARHLAAELAVNSWSDLLTVTPVGFGDELVDLAPHRVHPVDTAADRRLHAALRESAGRDTDDVLDGRLRAGAGDGWMPQVVLAPRETEQDGELGAAAAALQARKQRAPVAVLLAVEPAPGADEWLLRLTDDGSLLVPALGLRLPAPQLTAQQARDIAALLAFERNTGDEAVPAADGDRPWQLHTDAAGALRDNASGPGSAPPSPRPALREARHRPSAATLLDPTTPTPTDTQPGTPPGMRDVDGAPTRSRPVDLRRRIQADLDQLDRDLADWWSPDCTRPRLTLLGPVTLRAQGDETAAARSGMRRRHEEMVAYLATRPHGATADEAATALRPARGGRTDLVSARAYVHRVTAGARARLGTDATTGQKHLSSGHRGRYTLTGVLVDADLFRQLRARAGVRGNDGLPDLLAALELVSGPPFAHHPAGYEWLDGLDLTLTAAICDVAHQLVTVALADGDLAAAGTASATALLVAPDDERVLLDAMWVAYHQGNRAEAETFVARIVTVHDGEDEMDLPMSTAETINRARQEFLDRAS
jgi:nucleoid-associated protein YgaU/DNA-binding SARP family transcriptional activator